MADHYQVTLNKQLLTFSAAHFITFQGNICERLHGHNYRVYATVDGKLDENHYVIDFIALRDTLAWITSKLDHRMLLPTKHPMIHVETISKEIHVKFEDRRWVFPAGDCVLLPVPNTTAEQIAWYIGEQLLNRWRSESVPIPDRLEIGVDENEGQWGIWATQPERNPQPPVQPNVV